MPNLCGRRQVVVAVGFATVLVVSVLAAAVVFSSSRWAHSGGITFQTFKSPTMPVDQLLIDPRACVAVVEPVERGAVYGVGVEQRSDFGVYVEDVEYDGDWPFTPVTVRVLESLRGEIPETIVVWGKRVYPWLDRGLLGPLPRAGAAGPVDLRQRGGQVVSYRVCGG